MSETEQAYRKQFKASKLTVSHTVEAMVILLDTINNYEEMAAFIQVTAETFKELHKTATLGALGELFMEASDSGQVPSTSEEVRQTVIKKLAALDKNLQSQVTTIIGNKVSEDDDAPKIFSWEDIEKELNKEDDN